MSSAARPLAAFGVALVALREGDLAFPHVHPGDDTAAFTQEVR